LIEKKPVSEALSLFRDIRSLFGSPDGCRIIPGDGKVTLAYYHSLVRFYDDDAQTGIPRVISIDTELPDGEWVEIDELEGSDGSSPARPDDGPPNHFTKLDDIPPYERLYRFGDWVFHGKRVWSANKHRAYMWHGSTPLQRVVDARMMAVAERHFDNISVGRNGGTDFVRDGDWILYADAPSVKNVDSLPELIDGIGAPEYRVRLVKAFDIPDKESVGFTIDATLNVQRTWILQRKYLEEVQEELERPVEFRGYHTIVDPTRWIDRHGEIVIMPMNPYGTE